MNEARVCSERLNLIRREKFDLVLPKAMKKNKIDMWIHVMRKGNPDPLRLDLGSDSDCFMFTDRGGDRIERAVLGRGSSTVHNCGAYDIITGEGDWEKDLREFVAERDPKHIAVNFSEWLAVSDGISHTDYLKLVKALGGKYAKKVVSAENVITDFRSERVMSEIVFYGQLCKITVDIVERGLLRVKPGVTTLKDVSQWLTDQYISRGFGSEIQFDQVGVFLRDPAGHESDADDHVIQGGNLVHLDFGVIMMNYRTDLKRIAYVLREGENVVPPEIQKAFDDALKAHKIFRKNIKVGRTAGKTLEIIKSKLEEAGYVYRDRDEYDRNADPEKTQIYLDFHCLGHAWGDQAVGARISPLGSDRTRNLNIPIYNLFVLEFMIHMPVPEWGKGKHIYLAYEDDVIVTQRGVEFLYPPQDHLCLIH